MASKGSTDERHLIYRSLDVLVHAHVGLAEWDAAGALLAEYGPGAQRCCRRCRRDVFYRRADLAVEERDPDAALDHLDRALAALGDDVDAGAPGRDAETMRHLGRFRDRIRGVSSPTAVRTSCGGSRAPSSAVSASGVKPAAGGTAPARRCSPAVPACWRSGGCGRAEALAEAYLNREPAVIG